MTLAGGRAGGGRDQDGAGSGCGAGGFGVRVRPGLDLDRAGPRNDRSRRGPDGDDGGRPHRAEGQGGLGTGGSGAGGLGVQDGDGVDGGDPPRAAGRAAPGAERAGQAPPGGPLPGEGEAVALVGQFDRLVQQPARSVGRGGLLRLGLVRHFEAREGDFPGLGVAGDRPLSHRPARRPRIVGPSAPRGIVVSRLPRDGTTVGTVSLTDE